MQGAGTVRDRKGVARADIGGELLFELFGLGAGGDPSGAQRIDDFALFGGTDGGTMEWNLAHCGRWIKSYGMRCGRGQQNWVCYVPGIFHFLAEPVRISITVVKRTGFFAR